MQERLTSMGWQLLRVWEVALQRRSLVLFVSSFLIAALTVSLVPDREPSIGEWTRLFLVLVFAGFAVALMTRRMSDDPVTRIDRQMAGAIWLLPALLLSGLSDPVAALLLLIFVILLVYSPLRARRTTPWWSVILRLTWMVPIWAILMVDAWSTGLLLLIPVSYLAMLADWAMRYASRRDPRQTSALTARALRLLGWLILLWAAAILLIAAIFINVEPAWVLIGAGAAVALSAVDVLLPDRYVSSYVAGVGPALLLERAAFVVLTVSWLGALPA